MTPPLGRAPGAIGVWLAGLVICAIVIARTEFTADMSAFLPRAPTAEQKVLVDQLRDGALSRLVLIGIEGADPETRASLSRTLGSAMRASNAFVGVHNGDDTETRGDRAYFFANRYLLSDAVTSERFSVAGLRAAIQESIDLLSSPAGMMLKNILPRDPTGETVRLLDQLAGGTPPSQLNGVWASRDGNRALLLAQTRASGSDIDAQQAALDLIADRFREARASVPALSAPESVSPTVPAPATAATLASASSARLIVSGNGAFAVASRATIQREVLRLSLLSAAIVIALLLVIYRSTLALGLGLLPVVSGAVAAVAAVSAGFGQVHGLTLGFGTTLIGEAVDYSIYLFIQSEGLEANERGDRQWLQHFWPTVRLGVLASIFGFASLLFSGFPGLAQLGLYSITGLVVAAAFTRFVLPSLLPRGFRVRDISPIGAWIERVILRASKARWGVAFVALLAAAVLFTHRDTLWNRELSALSPVPQADLDRHEQLRTAIGAPDTRYLIVASAIDANAALRESERAASALQPLVDAGVLAGIDAPSRFLPSAETQASRQLALPDRDELKRRLQVATADLPLRAERLEPFLDDVAASKQRAPLLRADLDGTSVAEAIDALLVNQGGRWNAVMPLRLSPTPNGTPAAIDAVRVRTALSDAKVDGALFVDVTTETQALYAAYLRQAIGLALGGFAAIAVLLLIALRSVKRMMRVVLPLVAAVLVVVAAIVVAGKQLTIMHLIGMLLIVAIGSNYALFFDQRAAMQTDIACGATRNRMLASLLCANLTTVAGFGLLAFSSVPVLQAIGVTVGPGAILALIFSAVLALPQARGVHMGSDRR